MDCCISTAITIVLLSTLYISIICYQWKRIKDLIEELKKDPEEK